MCRAGRWLCKGEREAPEPAQAPSAPAPLDASAATDGADAFVAKLSPK